MTDHFRSICLKFSLKSFLLLFWLAGSAQKPDMSALDQLISQHQKELGKNLVVMVYKDSALIYKKETGELFNSRAQAPLGAASQWLTAALAMSFVDQGKITLDEPLGRYLPVLEKYMKGYITLRNCLTQTTGIEDEQTRLGKLLKKKKYQTLEEAVNGLAAREIHNNPGKEFSYGDVGLTIAARVCEVLGKKPFERLMQERITRPLKMRSTSFFNDDGSAPNPSSGGRTTANDYMNFLIMILHKGVFENKRILSEKAIDEMEKASFTDLPVVYSPPSFNNWHYGMGVWLLEEDQNGQGIVMSAPSLHGSWPIIDRKHGYAALLLLQSAQDDAKVGIMNELRENVGSN